MFEQVGYQPTRGHSDEAVGPDGRVRPSWSVLGSAFGEVRPGQLLEHQRQTDRLLDAEGAGHLVHELAHERWPDAPAGSTGDSRPWRLDPVPLVLDDPLVYSDDDRLAKVCGVLERASAHLQIIVLTCRATAFQTLSGHSVSVTAWRPEA